MSITLDDRALLKVRQALEHAWWAEADMPADLRRFELAAQLEDALRVLGAGEDDLPNAAHGGMPGMPDKVRKAAERAKPLQWYQQKDAEGNTMWVGDSPYSKVDGTPLQWRLKQRLAQNAVEWYEGHDDPLMQGNTVAWPDIQSAKVAIHTLHHDIIAFKIPLHGR